MSLLCLPRVLRCDRDGLRFGPNALLDSYSRSRKPSSAPARIDRHAAAILFTDLKMFLITITFHALLSVWYGKKIRDEVTKSDLAYYANELQIEVGGAKRSVRSRGIGGRRKFFGYNSLALSLSLAVSFAETLMSDSTFIHS